MRDPFPLVYFVTAQGINLTFVFYNILFYDVWKKSAAVTSYKLLLQCQKLPCHYQDKKNKCKNYLEKFSNCCLNDDIIVKYFPFQMSNRSHFFV